jgi:hypothetical protein
MLRDYDFSQGVRGKYARRYARGSNVVVLEPDAAKVFPNAEAVNKFAAQSGGDHSPTQIASGKIEERYRFGVQRRAASGLRVERRIVTLLERERRRHVCHYRCFNSCIVTGL